MKKKLLVLLLVTVCCVAFAFGLSACGSDTAQMPSLQEPSDEKPKEPSDEKPKEPSDEKPVEIAVESVTLSRSSLSLGVDDSTTLTASVKPSNATNKTLTWKSSNTAVVQVDNGTITAVGAGAAEITVTCGSKSSTCEVNVEIYITNLYFPQEEYQIIVGQSIETPGCYYRPIYATNTSGVTWEIADGSIAKRESGKITALASGLTTLTATTSNGVKATCKIRCLNYSFSLPDTPLTIDNWSNPSYFKTQTAVFNEVSYSLERTSNYNYNFKLKLILKGSKTYCYTSGSHAFKIGYKIYGEDNTVIESGIATSASCAVNESFVINATINLSDLQEGNYRIEFNPVAW